MFDWALNSVLFCSVLCEGGITGLGFWKGSGTDSGRGSGKVSRKGSRKGSGRESGGSTNATTGWLKQ